MTLRHACYRLFGALVAVVVLSFAAELPRPLGTLGAVAFVLAALFGKVSWQEAMQFAGR